MVFLRYLSGPFPQDVTRLELRSPYYSNFSILLGVSGSREERIFLYEYKNYKLPEGWSYRKSPGCCGHE